MSVRSFTASLALSLGLGLAALAPAAWALPTVDEVQAAAQKGDYPAAEKMMREVVEAKPGSAKAHYVLAEILAHQRKFNEATEQARLARLNDPQIKFTDPAKFSDFERKLEQAQGRGTAASVRSAAPVAVAPVREQPASSGGVPLWLLLGGGAVFIVLAARWMQRRAGAPVAAMPAYGGAGYGPGVGGMGYGPAPVQGGSGMLGVGLAAAGGVAAGMLAEKLLHEGDRGSRYVDDGGAGSFDNGASGAAADSLASRDVDFGSGGGWDAGGGGGDFGGGSDGGGDW
jgi:hypothetical protein